VVVQRGSPLVSRLQLPQGVPALLVVLHGLVAGKAHISQFGGHDIWEEEVGCLLRISLKHADVMQYCAAY
jgi:hypothetical protein